MNSKWKAKTLTLAVLSLGILFQPIAFGYDPNVFPGRGQRTDFEKANDLCRQAVVLKSKGKIRDSITCYKKAISIYPFSAAFHYNLGIAYSTVSDFGNSIPAFSKAVKLAPDFDQAYANLSDDQFRVKNYQAAERSALRATELNPRNPVAFINLAQAELALKKSRMALLHVKVAQGLPGAADYHSDLNTLLAQIRNSGTFSATTGN